MSSSATGSATITRVAAMHSCPALYMPAPAMALAVAARSVSSNTITGALPPSSRTERRGALADAAAMARPVATEPVNDTRSMSGWLTRSAPVVEPRPLTRFSTPAGRRSAATCTNRVVESGVFSAGLSTSVLPVARAGNTFHTACQSG